MVSRTFRRVSPVSRCELLERRALLSTTLSPVADADVQDLSGDAASVNSNFGADPSLRVRLAPDEKIETFLTFDITSIPSVGHAMLRLNGGQGTAVPGSDLVLVGAFATPDEFTEGTGTHGNPLSILPGLLGGLTFNNRPASGGDAFGSAIVTTTGDYYWNLTDYVRAAKTT